MPGEDVDDAPLAVDRERDLRLGDPLRQLAERRATRLVEAGVAARSADGPGPRPATGRSRRRGRRAPRRPFAAFRSESDAKWPRSILEIVLWPTPVTSEPDRPAASRAAPEPVGWPTRAADRSSRECRERPSICRLADVRPPVIHPWTGRTGRARFGLRRAGPHARSSRGEAPDPGLPAPPMAQWPISLTCSNLRGTPRTIHTPAPLLHTRPRDKSTHGANLPTPRPRTNRNI